MIFELQTSDVSVCRFYDERVCRFFDGVHGMSLACDMILQVKPVN